MECNNSKKSNSSSGWCQRKHGLEEATNELEIAADLAVASPHHVLAIILENLRRDIQSHHG
jgi:hypothetical protein